jgi:hypothetical protein
VKLQHPLLLLTAPYGWTQQQLQQQLRQLQPPPWFPASLLLWA